MRVLQYLFEVTMRHIPTRILHRVINLLYRRPNQVSLKIAFLNSWTESFDRFTLSSTTLGPGS